MELHNGMYKIVKKAKSNASVKCEFSYSMYRDAVPMSQ